MANIPLNSRVLILDDLSFIRLSIRHILSDLPLELVEADEIEELIWEIKEAPFSVALIDYRIKNIDGLKVVELMKKLQSPPPVFILITAYADKKLPFRAERAGVWKMMTKPFRAPELRQAVSEALNLYSNEQNWSSSSDEINPAENGRQVHPQPLHSVSDPTPLQKMLYEKKTGEKNGNPEENKNKPKRRKKRKRVKT